MNLRNKSFRRALILFTVKFLTNRHATDKQTRNGQTHPTELFTHTHTDRSAALPSLCLPACRAESSLGLHRRGAMLGSCRPKLVYSRSRSVGHFKHGVTAKTSSSAVSMSLVPAPAPRVGMYRVSSLLPLVGLVILSCASAVTCSGGEDSPALDAALASQFKFLGSALCLLVLLSTPILLEGTMAFRLLLVVAPALFLLEQPLLGSGWMADTHTFYELACEYSAIGEGSVLGYASSARSMGGLCLSLSPMMFTLSTTGGVHDRMGDVPAAGSGAVCGSLVAWLLVPTAVAHGELLRAGATTPLFHVLDIAFFCAFAVAAARFAFLRALSSGLQSHAAELFCRTTSGNASPLPSSVSALLHRLPPASTRTISLSAPLVCVWFAAVGSFTHGVVSAVCILLLRLSPPFLATLQWLQSVTIVGLALLVAIPYDQLALQPARESDVSESVQKQESKAQTSSVEGFGRSHGASESIGQAASPIGTAALAPAPAPSSASTSDGFRPLARAGSSKVTVPPPPPRRSSTASSLHDSTGAGVSPSLGTRHPSTSEESVVDPSTVAAKRRPEAEHGAVPVSSLTLVCVDPGTPGSALRRKNSISATAVVVDEDDAPLSTDRVAQTVEDRIQAKLRRARSSVGPHGRSPSAARSEGDVQFPQTPPRSLSRAPTAECSATRVIDSSPGARGSQRRWCEEQLARSSFASSPAASPAAQRSPPPSPKRGPPAVFPRSPPPSPPDEGDLTNRHPSLEVRTSISERASRVERASLEPEGKQPRPSIVERHPSLQAVTHHDAPHGTSEPILSVTDRHPSLEEINHHDPPHRDEQPLPSITDRHPSLEEIAHHHHDWPPGPARENQAAEAVQRSAASAPKPGLMPAVTKMEPTAAVTAPSRSGSATEVVTSTVSGAPVIIGQPSSAAPPAPPPRKTRFQNDASCASPRPISFVAQQSTRRSSHPKGRDAAFLGTSSVGQASSCASLIHSESDDHGIYAESDDSASCADHQSCGASLIRSESETASEADHRASLIHSESDDVHFQADPANGSDQRLDAPMDGRMLMMGKREHRPMRKGYDVSAEQPLADRPHSAAQQRTDEEAGLTPLLSTSGDAEFGAGPASRDQIGEVYGLIPALLPIGMLLLLPWLAQLGVAQWPPPTPLGYMSANIRLASLFTFAANAHSTAALIAAIACLGLQPSSMLLRGQWQPPGARARLFEDSGRLGAAVARRSLMTAWLSAGMSLAFSFDWQPLLHLASRAACMTAASVHLLTVIGLTVATEHGTALDQVRGLYCEAGGGDMVLLAATVGGLLSSLFSLTYLPAFEQPHGRVRLPLPGFSPSQDNLLWACEVGTLSALLIAWPAAARRLDIRYAKRAQCTPRVRRRTASSGTSASPPKWRFEDFPEPPATAAQPRMSMAVTMAHAPEEPTPRPMLGERRTVHTCRRLSVAL